MKTKKLIKAARKHIDYNCNTCVGCMYGVKNLDCFYYMMTDITNRLEKLHEKSKAKRVDDMEQFANEYIGFCPNCGDVVGSTKKYCQNCGQKLKWGVTK